MYLGEMRKTKLQAPLEFVNFHFLLEGVTRSFTHQLVRQRTACLSGDTVVHTKRRERRYSLKTLFEKFSAGGLDKTHVKSMKIRTCDDDGQIIYRRIGTVTQSGMKGVYEVKTHDGRSIKTTSDHRFLRPEGGYSQLAEMDVGDMVVSNGKKWTPEARAAFSEWCLENRGGRNPEKFSGVDPGHRQAQMMFGHLLELGCSWCGEEAEDLAHIDGNPMNNDQENVQPMCTDCHISMDRDTFPEKTYPARIVSIDYVGEEMTYDLGMKGEFPRFVANGLVVHNCYAQESLRFAVKEDLENSVGLPPSLADTELLVDYEYGPDELAGAQGQRGVWDRAIGAVAEAYDELIESGMPAEDARGILPHAVLTRVHYSCDLRALLDHAGNRLCTQAQFEWRAVFTRIVEAIRDSDAYMAGELADLFRPVCYQIGKCAFGADFDRHCDIRERVQVRAENGGADSTQWHKPFLHHTYDHVTGLPRGAESPGIAPYEWLGNPNAARPS